MKQERKTELDLLRIVAMFAVVLVHVCGMKTHELFVTDSNWQCLSFIAALLTWQIPIFVMISGRFFLDPERNVDFKKIWLSVKKLIVPLACWTVLYAIYSYFCTDNYSGLNWKGTLYQMLLGPYHFWYLWMMICLYLICPFLRKICEDKKLMQYFVILYLVFQTISSYGVNLPYIGSFIEEILSKSHIDFVLGYSGYYILGYYLYKWQLSERIEKILYIFAVPLTVITAIANTVYAVKCGVNNDFFSSYLRPNVAIVAIAVYTYFVKRVGKHQFSSKSVMIITLISKYSFGVYLVHALVLDLIKKAGISPTLITPYFMVPVIGVLAVILSNILVFLIKRIPVVGKYLT